MVKRESKVLLVIVFLLGCFASHVARTNFDVPPAYAQTTPALTSAQRWEYTCEAFTDAERIVPWLNQNGAQGWELTTLDGTGAAYICLKRPL
mgnify:CR=1 FL=1